MPGKASSPFIHNLDLLLAQLEAGVVIHRPDTSVSYANRSALDILGLTDEEIQGKIANEKDWHFVDSDGHRLAPEKYPVNLVLSAGQPIENLVFGIIDAQRKQPTWVKVAGFPEFDEQNRLQQIAITFIDISHERNNVSYEKIMSYASDVVLVTDAAINAPGPMIVSINQAFTNLLGYEASEIEGKYLSCLKVARKSLRTLLDIKRHMINGNYYRDRILLFSVSGQPLWLDINVFPLHNWQHRVSHYVAIGRDISDAVSREQTLMREVLLDPLTGLFNRRGLDSQLERFNKRQTDNSYSMITLDVDRFKQINDLWSHEVGDIVLVEVARIMRETVRDIDCVARIGGEEFVILLPAMSEDLAWTVAERIRDAIEKHHIALNNRDEINVTASLGVAEKVCSENPMRDTLNRADDALYHAKRSGRNRVASARQLSA